MKGVSPLIASVLLIAIVVSVSLIVSQWSSAFSKTQVSAVTNQTQQQLSCEFSNLYIKNATFFCNNNCASGVYHMVNVSVVNSGKRNIIITAFTLRNTTGNLSVMTLNETKTIQPSSTLVLTNVSYASCAMFNNSIDSIVVSSTNCPANAYDSLPGASVAYAGC